MSEYFKIGKIVTTHGIKGAVKVFPLTDDPSRFELLEDVIIENRGQIETFKIQKIQYFKNQVIIKFDKLDSINNAELYKNAFILINKEEALPLDNDEYYISDLIGLNVETIDGDEIGTLIDIIYTGSNDVYVVENKDTKKQILLPAIKDCIKKVNLEQSTITVEIMKGLDYL